MSMETLRNATDLIEFNTIARSLRNIDATDRAEIEELRAEIEATSVRAVVGSAIADGAHYNMRLITVTLHQATNCKGPRLVARANGLQIIACGYNYAQNINDQVVAIAEKAARKSSQVIIGEVLGISTRRKNTGVNRNFCAVTRTAAITRSAMGGAS